MDDSLTLLGFGPEGWGHALLNGGLTTLAVSACAFVLGLGLGTLLAWARIAGSATLQRFAQGYGVVMRGIPDLLVIYLFYFGGRQIASAVAKQFGHVGPVEISGFAAGCLAIGLLSAATQAEVLRGAYQALSPGTLEAARVTGMRRWTMFQRIIAPLALRTALPGLGNQWQSVIKESALVSVTGLVETLRAVTVAANSTELPFLFFLAGGAIYLAITTLSGFVFRIAEWRAMRGQPAATGRG
ncbi:ABC transporter permease [Bosea sp. (in: a-proteobacteria)]|uniref:ABC transporter permease n=1 Tax=Bosea sp. (in: a-proteobacteria) TaxID=1871050 RepID=UPI003B3B7D45